MFKLSFFLLLSNILCTILFSYVSNSKNKCLHGGKKTLFIFYEISIRRIFFFRKTIRVRRIEVPLCIVTLRGVRDRMKLFTRGTREIFRRLRCTDNVTLWLEYLHGVMIYYFCGIIAVCRSPVVNKPSSLNVAYVFCNSSWTKRVTSPRWRCCKWTSRTTAITCAPRPTVSAGRPRWTGWPSSRTRTRRTISDWWTPRTTGWRCRGLPASTEVNHKRITITTIAVDVANRHIVYKWYTRNHVQIHAASSRTSRRAVSPRYVAGRSLPRDGLSQKTPTGFFSGSLLCPLISFFLVADITISLIPRHGFVIVYIVSHEDLPVFAISPVFFIFTVLPKIIEFFFFFF